MGGATRCGIGDAGRRCSDGGPVLVCELRAAGAAGPSAAARAADRGCGVGRPLGRVRQALRADRAAVDPAREAVAGAAAAGVLLGALGAPADRAARATTCCSAGSSASRSTIRCGTSRCSPRTATGCSRATIAAKFFQAVLSQPPIKALLSDEHFTVDGTLIEAWASMKSFKPQGRSRGRATGGRRPQRRARLPRRAAQQRHPCLDHRPRGAAAAQGPRQGGEALLHGPPADGEPPRPDRRCPA